MNVSVESQYDYGRRTLTIVTTVADSAHSYAATLKDVDSIEAGNALTDYVKMLRELGADVTVPRP